MSTTTALPVIRTCRICKTELPSGLRGRPRVYCTTCRPPHKDRQAPAAPAEAEVVE